MHREKGLGVVVVSLANDSTGMLLDSFPCRTDKEQPARVLTVSPVVLQKALVKELKIHHQQPLFDITE